MPGGAGTVIDVAPFTGSTARLLRPDDEPASIAYPLAPFTADQASVTSVPFTVAPNDAGAPGTGHPFTTTWTSLDGGPSKPLRSAPPRALGSFPTSAP